MIVVIILCIITVGCSNVKVGYDAFLTLKNEYSHSTDSYTQGLFFYNDVMYESIGLYGSSKLLKNIDIPTGECENNYVFGNDIFAEGSVVYNSRLYVLTWKENKIFAFEPDTLELLEIYDYNREGWGLTTDGEFLITSDGSSKIYYMDQNLQDVKVIEVTYKGNPVNNINELEYINGYIWANIWHTNKIIIINPKNGETIKVIDFKGLYTKEIKDPDDVLNGIAYNKNTGSLYITGKRWDTLFEFSINDKKFNSIIS